MPATGTLEDLGKLVQSKYPAYQSLDPAQVGKLVQAKYPGHYDSFSPALQSANAADPGAPDAPQAAGGPIAAPAPPQAASMPAGPVPGPGAGSPSASGFGIPSATPPPSLTPPPGYQQGLFVPNEFNRRAAKQFDVETDTSARGEEARQTKQFDIAAARADIEHYVSILKSEGIWEKLSPRQRADVYAGSKNITPERAPITLKGYQKAEDILKGDPNARDYPVAGGTTKRNIIDPSAGKAYLVTYDRAGTEIHREETIDPRLLPTTSSNSGVSLVTQQIEDPVTHRLMTVQVPTPHSGSTVTQRTVPGGSASPTLAPSGARPQIAPPPGTAASPGSVPTSTRGPAAAPTASTPAPASTSPTASASIPGLPKGSRVLGSPPAQQKQDVENPLTPQALSIVMKVKPQIDMLDHLLTQLEPYRNSKLPGTTLLKSIAYRMGFSQDQNGVDELLSNLDMTGITSAASVLQGTSRAASILGQAKLHTPDGWKDAGGLQYDKVKAMRTRLQTMLDVAKGPEGQRFPGLTPPPSASTSTSSDDGPPVSALTEGHDTTFKNGQVWSLQHGKKVRVK